MWPSNSTPRIEIKRIKTSIKTKAAALFTIAKMWKQVKCPSIDKWRNQSKISTKWKLFSHIKEWYADPCYNMDDLENLCYVKVDRYKRSLLYYSMYLKYLEWVYP